MSEGQGLNEQDIKHFCKSFVDNVELETFQFLKNAFIIYFFVLMCYNLFKYIIDPLKKLIEKF